jgi:hypothetical protein
MNRYPLVVQDKAGSPGSRLSEMRAVLSQSVQKLG